MRFSVPSEKLAEQSFRQIFFRRFYEPSSCISSYRESPTGFQEAALLQKGPRQGMWGPLGAENGSPLASSKKGEALALSHRMSLPGCARRDAGLGRVVLHQE